MIVTLNKFISKASNHTRSLLQPLIKGSTYRWTPECQQLFDNLKTYLQTPPILTTPISGDIINLYLGVLDFAISDIIFKEIDKVQKPIYWVSKTYKHQKPNVHQLECQHLPSSLQLRSVGIISQAYRIRVYTNQPLMQAFKSHDKKPRMKNLLRDLDSDHIEFLRRIPSKAVSQPTSSANTSRRTNHFV